MSKEEVQEEVKEIKCIRKPIYIDVKRDGNYLNVDTPFYQLENLPVNKVESITAPFAGIGYELELSCDDSSVENMIRHYTLSHSTWKQYLVDNCEAYENYFTNIFKASKCFNIKSVKGCAKRGTVLLVGGGPSVYDNLDELKKVIDNKSALVIACGSGIRLLANHDIKPHMCLAFDPYHTEYDHVFSNISQEYTKDIPLITFFGLETRCFEHWLGPKLISGGQSGMGNHSFIDEFDHVSEGGIGVSTCGLFLANYMEADNVALLGFDLCYKQDGDKLLSHADRERDDIFQEVETDGVYTNRLWLKERKFLETHGRRLGFKGLYNASNGTLPIDGYIGTALSEISSKKAFKYTLKRITNQAVKEIDTKLGRLEIEFEKFAHMGMLHALKDTLAYKALFAPYDYLQHHRQMWTRTYDQSHIKYIAWKLYNTIKEARKNART